MLNRLSKLLLVALMGTGSLAAPAFAGASSSLLATSTGYDISYPQCGGSLPTPVGFGIVGVNFGHPFSANPCLSTELTWAGGSASGAPSFYMNTANPGAALTSDWPANQQTPVLCRGANTPACSYDFGWNAAQVSFADAVGAETAVGSATPGAAARLAHWWLDVETGNAWQTIESTYGPTALSKLNDQQMLEGSLAALTSLGVIDVGIYSTPSQWRTVTGGTDATFPPVPVWMPGYATISAAQTACASASFTGGRVAMIQYPSIGLDGDYVCPLLSSPSTASVTTSTSATYTSHLTVAGDSAAVTFVQSTGAPQLLVGPTGLVTTSGALAAGTYTAAGTTSDANANSGAFLFTLTVGLITQSSALTGVAKVPSTPSFSTQLVVSGQNGAVTFVQSTGAPQLLVGPTGLVTTSGALAAGTYTATGTTSDAFGDVGSFSYALTVGAITQNAPLTVSVATTDLATSSTQLSVSHNDGPVTFVQSTGASTVVVSPSGLVTPSPTLAPGTYTVRGTTTDAFGDLGTFVFTYKVTSPPPPPTFQTGPLRVIGYAQTGRSVTMAVTGVGFYGRPVVTSHTGTDFVVTRDTGAVLTLKVSVRARSRHGVYTLTIALANGESRQVRYNQR